MNADQRKRRIRRRETTRRRARFSAMMVSMNPYWTPEGGEYAGFTPEVIAKAWELAKSWPESDVLILRG